MKQFNGGNAYSPTGKEKNLEAILNIHRHFIEGIPLPPLLPVKQWIYGLIISPTSC